MDVLSWHRRYLQQAGWTRPLRDYLFQQINLGADAVVLDVGCGTGALLEEFAQRGVSACYGIDIAADNLSFAQSSAVASPAHLIRGDAHCLPFPGDTFDLSFCHYTLLWVSDPAQVVAEMRRVTRPGGYVLALAEPDYGGRIDYPYALTELANLQTQSLRRQGADPHIGRKLRQVFRSAGLNPAGGILGSQWPASQPAGNLNQDANLQEDAENDVLASDLQELPLVPGQAEELLSLSRQARQSGEQILYIPTFYAWSQVS